MKLSAYLESNPGYQFEIRHSRNSPQKKIAITFPYGQNIKGSIDKDNKNFDYKVEMILNRKLLESMYLILFINRFLGRAGVMRLAEQIAKEDLEREMKRL